MKQKALFLDRDGVINVDKGYVYRRENFQFHEGIFDLCRAAQGLGYLLVIVTNQAGVARGYYSEADFFELTHWMVAEFANQGIQIARIYHCPYHPVHGVNEYRQESSDRKPNPGMILRAARELNLDLRGSVLIGDKLSDIDAGENAGVGINILVRSRYARKARTGSRAHVVDLLDQIRKRFFEQTVDISSTIQPDAC